MRTVNTIKVAGIGYDLIKCECEVTDGIGIHLVGLADTAVKECLLRTVTALQSLGYRIPGKRIVINLAPATIMKNGCGYDLAVALSLLAASGQVELKNLEKYVVLGELGLTGYVREVPGCVQACKAAMDNDMKVIIPRANAAEVDDLFEDVCAVDNLVEAIEVIETGVNEREKESAGVGDEGCAWDWLGDDSATRRGLEIAAAGGHNLLLMGAPTSAKATYAQALRDLLPPMNAEEAMEVASIYSAAGRKWTRRRPFRAPYYASSTVAWFGGGEGVKPGEVSLADRGVLYMSEFNQVPKIIKEAVQGVVDDGRVVISRLRGKAEYPSRFQLVVGTEPCPCGWYGEGDLCKCTKSQRERWLNALGGPLMDRIDVQCWVHEGFNKSVESEPAVVVAERVAAARKRQMERQGKLNAELRVVELPVLSEESQNMAEELIERIPLNARVYSRMLRIARTIADLEGVDEIKPCHLAEASCYRFLDKRLED